MSALIMGLGFLAISFACIAVFGFIKTYRKPPPPRDLNRDWLGNDPQ